MGTCLRSIHSLPNSNLMNPHPSVVALAIFLGGLSISSGQPQSPVASSPVPTARIIGKVQDGTPPPPEAPRPVFIVPAQDILKTKSQQQGGRRITVQEIKPIALPAPVEPPSPPDLGDSAVRAHIAAMRGVRPEAEFFGIGATVYRSNSAATRTLFTYRSGQADQSNIVFVSSMDASLLQGISQYEGADGIIRSFFMAWSVDDADAITARLAASGRTYQPPALPSLPDGPVTFTILSGNPSVAALATIRSLHDIYHKEYANLLAARENREKVRIEREAALKAKPPKPKDIVLSYWRLDTSKKSNK